MAPVYLDVVSTQKTLRRNSRALWDLRQGCFLLNRQIDGNTGKKWIWKAVLFESILVRNNRAWDFEIRPFLMGGFLF